MDEGKVECGGVCKKCIGNCVDCYFVMIGV